MLFKNWWWYRAIFYLHLTLEVRHTFSPFCTCRASHIHEPMWRHLVSATHSLHLWWKGEKMVSIVGSLSLSWGWNAVLVSSLEREKVGCFLKGMVEGVGTMQFSLFSRSLSDPLLAGDMSGSGDMKEKEKDNASLPHQCSPGWWERLFEYCLQNWVYFCG